MMSNAVFDTLAAYTPDGRAVPYLAESFSSSPDFLQWTVKLRPGITFHDGTPLDSAAVVKNFETQRNDALVGLAVRPFFPESDAVTVVDDLTLTFNLLEPNAHWPSTVTGQLGMVSSPAWLDAALADPTLNQQPVGTGPFVFDSRSEDSVTRFVRNDAWWGGEVFLDAVEFYPVPEPNDRLELLLGGDLEALQTTDPDVIIELRDDDSIQNVLDDSGEESFAMINSSAAPFDDLRARQALAYATPRQNYIDLIGLGAVRGADGMFIPESPYFNPDVKQAGDDPESAAPLVEAYCAERGTEQNPVTGTPTCTDGKINIELQWSGPGVTAQRIAEILDEGWSEFFNVSFDELLQDEHVQQTAFGQYNVNTWRQFGAADPMGDNVWLMCRNIGGISLNWPRFCDEERDALLLQAQAATDPAERAGLYSQLEQMVNEDFLYIFFIHTLWDNAFTENVRGVCDRTSPEGELLACATLGRTWFSTVWLDG
jgi:ABC-type transport system substrate-binding protein